MYECVELGHYKIDCLSINKRQSGICSTRQNVIKSKVVDVVECDTYPNLNFEIEKLKWQITHLSKSPSIFSSSSSDER